VTRVVGRESRQPFLLVDLPPSRVDEHTLEVTPDQLDIFRDLYPDL
jgi:hypothetical protein